MSERPAYRARLFDEQDCVRVDAPCLNCGYNLRTLPAAGRCPKCGQPVGASLREALLRFAEPQWVRRLARGLLLVLIGIGVWVAGGFIMGMVFIVIGMMNAPAMGAPPTVTPIYTTPMIWVQCIFGVGMAVLMMVGLLFVSRAEPIERETEEGLSARRILRFAAWFMPVSALLWLFIASVWTGQAAAGMGMPDFDRFDEPGLLAINVVNWLVAFVAYGVAPLALLRWVAALMRRVPRDGLTRFAQVVFWGSLVAGGVAVLGFAWWMITFLPVMQQISALAPVTMPTSGPVIVTATAPATMPVAMMPTITPGFVISGIAYGLGGCASFGFGVAAIVLLIMAQRALSAAAGEAAHNAAEAG